MPSSQHILMGKYAYDSLPAWEQNFWKGQREKIAKNSLAPDQYYANKAKLAQYCIMPNGVVIPHGPTDKDWGTLPFVHSCCLENHRYVIEYYLGKLVETISAGDSSESAMFAAVFGHFLQDSSQPAHLVHNDLLYTLVPRPEEQYRHLHRDLDDADPDEYILKQIKPRLLGRTISEAAFHLRIEYETMIQRALTQLVPMISAAYTGDKKAMSRSITQLYKTATFLTASAWHTAHCIAKQKFDKGNLDKLQVVRLNKVPYSHGFTLDPYGFHPLLDCACDGKGNIIPLTLKVKGENGCEKTATFINGIAMTWGNVEYDIPRGIYNEFQVKIGLLSSVPEQSKAIFKVILDGKPVVYEEAMATILDYGGPIVFDSEVITGRDTARDIVIPLGKAAKITLITECPEENTHALWVEPVLVKEKHYD